MEEIIERARILATRAHAGQRLKNRSQRPYITHCEEVAGLVRASGGSDEEIAAAWLHDVVEDTETKIEEIGINFGEEVARIVDALTDPKHPAGVPKLPTIERKKLQAARVKTEDSSARRVKLADQIANVRTMGIDQPIGWNKQKCIDYVKGAGAVAKECFGVSNYLDSEFMKAYNTALIALGGSKQGGKSVGAIIKNEKGEYLAQYRLKHPTGLALPAGHVDDGESPEDALRRELAEETGLDIKSSKLVLSATFPNPCGKGHKNHEWWVYEVIAEGKPRLIEPDKHKFLEFLSPAEMKPFVLRGECDPAWFDHIFPALGIVI